MLVGERAEGLGSFVIEPLRSVIIDGGGECGNPGGESSSGESRASDTQASESVGLLEGSPRGETSTIERQGGDDLV